MDPCRHIRTARTVDSTRRRRRPRRSVGKGAPIAAAAAAVVAAVAVDGDASSSPSPSAVDCKYLSSPPLIMCCKSNQQVWGITSAAQYEEDDLRDLAHPIGMSFASVVSQVLDGNISSQGRVPVDYLCHVCTSAVKESITNMHGERFDAFIKYFEKSFGSTLKTLRKISDVSINQLENATNSPSSLNHFGSSITTDGSSTFHHSTRNGITSCSSSAFNHSSGSANIVSSSGAFDHFESVPASNTLALVEISEDVQESAKIDEGNNQLMLHAQTNQQLAHVTHGIPYSHFSQSLLNTYEKSVKEQTRSNDLKELEIGISIDKLKLEQSQLALESEANILKEMKIEVAISKVLFKEEKQSIKMREIRHRELSRTFNDILATGLIIMCLMIAYGTYIFSYERIMNLTSACTPLEVKRSWWMPKQIAYFGPILQSMRCNVVATSRISFGALLILVIVYLLSKRSATSSATTPVTLIMALLGIIGGSLGKLCVDTLGGDGYQWLAYWEGYCMIHLFATLFPAGYYRILYGHGSGSQGTKRGRLPYMITRCMFYFIMMLVYPTWSGLSPFASLDVWKEHFSHKLLGWR